MFWSRILFRSQPVSSGQSLSLPALKWSNPKQMRIICISVPPKRTSQRAYVVSRTKEGSRESRVQRWAFNPEANSQGWKPLPWKEMQACPWGLTAVYSQQWGVGSGPGAVFALCVFLATLKTNWGKSKKPQEQGLWFPAAPFQPWDVRHLRL